MLKTLFASFFLMLALAGTAFSQAAGLPSVSAIRAYEQSQAGKWFLVDIRSRGEWQQGVAEGAALISMHEPGFLQKLEELTGGDKQAKIAIICAVGSRSGLLQPQLMARGWRNIYNVSEGMKGSTRSVGWEERGLPIVKP